MDQNVKSNDTDSVDRTWTKPCIEIMSKDISVVKVRLETSKYITAPPIDWKYFQRDLYRMKEYALGVQNIFCLKS